jgi:hypothetical protein
MKRMIPWKWYAFALIGVVVALFVIAVLGTVGKALSAERARAAAKPKRFSDRPRGVEPCRSAAAQGSGASTFQ